MAGERIWYEDPVRWFAADNYYAVLPTSDMSLAGKLNALTRLALYLGVAGALLARDSRYLFVGISTVLLSAVLYGFQQRKVADTEKFLEGRRLDVVDNALCVRSTVDNPFMNPTMADIGDAPDRPRACALDNPAVTAVVEQNFHKRLFKSVDDLWNKQASQRQFYTVPSTTIPNDRETFQQWLYGGAPSCKEGNGQQCYRNLHTPLQKS